MLSVETTKTLYKISDFISWQTTKNLTLSPSFQRRAVWKPSAKSYLIDTIVRGLPIPIIFIREKTDPSTLETKREVVDGQQRLRTIFSFVRPEILPDHNKDRDGFTVLPSHNKDIARKSFAALDIKMKKAILNYEFSTHVFPSDTEDRDVLQIFARMNATGVKLNDQELRNAKYFGEFKTIMYELAYEYLPKWRAWGVFNEDRISRMLEVELVSELIILIMSGLVGKAQNNISKVYSDNDDHFNNGELILKRFRHVIDSIDELLGKSMQTLVFRQSTWFYTLFALIYDLQYGLLSKQGDLQFKNISPKSLPTNLAGKIKEVSDRVESGKMPEEISEVLRGRTTNLDARRKRLEFLSTTLKK